MSTLWAGESRARRGVDFGVFRGPHAANIRHHQPPRLERSAVAAGRDEGLIIGSDQVAECDGEPVGKPGTHDRAVTQLERLSGRTVVFHTGVALVNAATGRAQVAMVDVASTYRPLSIDEIEHYLRRETPYDCAGSVRSEGLGIALFERIASDDPSALVGLPLITVARMLREEGVDVLVGAR